MKNNHLRAFFFICLLFLPILTYAATSFDYTPMEEVPGLGKSGDFYTYITYVYKFGIWAVGIAALFMIIFGGYMYITSAGNNASMENAKRVVTDAIVGLILALLSYLILYIINPDLVRITPLPKITSGPTTTSPGTTPGTTPPAPSTIGDDQAIRDKLKNAGISINKANCSSPEQTDCTSLTGLPDKVVNNLIKIKNACGSAMIVTGGTEAGHQSHGQGKSRIDLSFNDSLANCIRNNVSGFEISRICTMPGDQPKYSYNCSYNESNRHLHLDFS